ncbi:heme NO-binding domain-containing protein [Thalassotalea montiporae]
MKGAIFCGYSEYIEQAHGLLTWLDIVDRSELAQSSSFIATDIYEDKIFVELLTISAELLNVSLSDILTEFGEFLFPTLLGSAKHHIGECTNVFEFLDHVENVIHIEVKKADPLAYTPSLILDTVSNSELLIKYTSHRQVCFLAEGLIYGAAKHFNQKVTIEHLSCTHQGDKHCLMKVTTVQPS